MKPDNVFWKPFLLLVALPALCGAWPSLAPAAERPVVSIVTDAATGKGANHGLEKLTAALRAKNVSYELTVSLDNVRGNFLLVVGLATDEGPAARLLKAGNHPLPQWPEALVIRQTQSQGKLGWIIGGADDRGLMYAALDVADRIAWSDDRSTPLSEVREAVERAAVRYRAVSVYTMNRAYWERWKPSRTT